jgi:hypothetical protein
LNQYLLSRHDGVAAAASQFSPEKSFGPAADIIRVDARDPLPAQLITEIASRGVINLKIVSDKKTARATLGSSDRPGWLIPNTYQPVVRSVQLLDELLFGSPPLLHECFQRKLSRRHLKIRSNGIIDLW